jgi:hypothetical protein
LLQGEKESIQIYEEGGDKVEELDPASTCYCGHLGLDEEGCLCFGGDPDA